MSQGIIPPAAISTPSLSGDQTWTGQQNFSGGLGSTRMAGPDPWFDVTHPKYAGGADPTGVADSKAAIQAAINACAATTYGGTVWFPSGLYTVNSNLTLPAKVFLLGQSHRVTTNVGTVVNFQPGIDGITPTGDGCGMQGFSFNAGVRQLYVPNGINFFKLQDCTFINPTTCGIYVGASSQWWELDDVNFIGGQYGMYFAANGVDTTWQSAVCRNVQFNAHTKKAMYFKFNIVSTSVVWDALVMHFMQPATGEAGGGLQIDSTGQRADGWLFLNPNMEGLGGSEVGKTAYTTCSGTSGGSTVTLAAKTGTMPDGTTAAWAVGQQVTIGGIWPNGTDYHANISGVSGLVLTLDNLEGSLPSSFSTAPITPYQGDEIQFMGTATFTNPVWGTSVGTRYSLNAGFDQGSGSIAVIGGGLSQISPRPIYDPYCKVYTQSTFLPVRRGLLNTIPTDRRVLQRSYLESLAPGQAVNEAIWPRRSQLAAPGGGDFRITLGGSDGVGGGTFGKFRLTKVDVVEGTDVVTCDTAGNLATFASGTLAPGSNTTVNRPSTTGLAVGAMFFDTTLNKPIWWNGTNWKDATGATV